MDFMTSIKTCFSKYVTFSGRAQRSEFWWFMLFAFAGQIILSIVDSTLFGTVTTVEGGFEAQTDTPILSGLFSLGIFLPALAVAVRRLHDTDRSGWWYLLCLIPLVGIIILIVWWAGQGTNGANRFGADPLGGSGGGMGGGDDYAPSTIPSVSND
ncbi:DUF805 domain-containing protein [Aliiroseovarius subalbicans]|uniref:DUF805 domain-containing protein n=1 Tax=Aliiroseovarius subalbicans TaxID=2925840 RepID=UPI001F57DD3E|nr:DUF805 domain-containing protein [Aliiroseovarius subalbicans]MCI2399589.1 DUF805 domain-containing protein [Aliiroseovarius subalbicans]